jgi:hypothetical protein
MNRLWPRDRAPLQGLYRCDMLRSKIAKQHYAHLPCGNGIWDFHANALNPAAAFDAVAFASRAR